MIIDDINIDSLLKAFQNFESFRLYLITKQDKTGTIEKAGTIHAYAYYFELAWKTMQRLLAHRGKTANSPKTAFRMAALENFIEDPELWFDFLDKRNLTVHSYQEAAADRIIEILPNFSQEIKTFLKNIGVPENAIPGT